MGRRKSLLHGRAHQLITQYHMIDPESIHPRNILQAERVVFRESTCLLIHVCACDGNQGKGRHEFERARKGIGED